MYRLSLGKRDFILRFSRKIVLDPDERAAVCSAILGSKFNPAEIGDRQNTVVFHRKLGAILLDIDTIPSLVLTVLAVIPEHEWIESTEPRR